VGRQGPNSGAFWRGCPELLLAFVCVGSQTAMKQRLGAARITAQCDRLGSEGLVLLTLALAFTSYQPAIILS
jgi:hypothetical protein